MTIQSNVYEEVAELILSSFVGQLSGMTKAQIVQHLKNQSVSEEELRRTLAQAKQEAEQMVEEVQRQLQPGQDIAVAYRVGQLPATSAKAAGGGL